MVGGFNTNVRYQGRTFHVQTEDSGHQHPQVVTLLYEGGAILYSCKHSYQDRVTRGDLEHEVRAIMEEQHRGILRKLKSGELDAVLGAAASESAPRAPRAPGFGDGVMTSRPLAEVVLEHLAG